ncbi:MAG: nucleoside monophosphate kinase, partial [Spirochaetia bacterium]|nr:nucleoside monophosphate kinase [Spirochaetia bacterium]
LIEEKFIPIISRHALPGLSIINSEDPVFENPQALAMFLDIFSERGYQATVDIHKLEVPVQIENGSGKITSNRRKVYRFHIRFQGSTLQRN